MKLSILALLFWSLPSLAFAQAPPATAPSGTRYAHRIVRIAVGEFGGGSQSVVDLIQQRAATLAPAVLDLSQEELAKHLNYVVKMTNDGNVGFQLTLRVAPDRGRPAAKEFMDQLVAGLEAPLAKAYEKSRQEAVERVERNFIAAKRRLGDASAVAQDHRNRLREVAGRADVSVNGVQNAVAKLEDERQKLELDVMGKTARREALEEEIARKSELAEKRVNDDPILGELQKVVDAREQSVKRLEQLVASGQASQNELSESVAQAAETRAKLLERRRDAMAESGGGTLESFNRELTTLSVDLRELTARLKFVTERLDSLRKSMDMLDGLTQAEAELSSAREAEFKAGDEMRQLQRRLDQSKPPKAEVIDSTNRAEPPKQEEPGRSPF